MKTRMRILCLAIALAGAGSAQADDLLQIYQEARSADPVLAGVEARKLATDENVTQARSALLPQLGASIDYSRSRGGDKGTLLVPDPADPTGATLVEVHGSTAHHNQRSTAAVLNQSLVDISRWTAVKASRAGANASAANLDAAEQELLIRTAQAYFGVLSSLDALRFAEANERALGRQLEQARQRFDVGLVAITDVNDAKAQHDQARASVIAQGNALQQAREAVRLLTNREPGEFRRLREDLPLDRPTPDDPAQWVEVALRENPALNASAYLVEAASANVGTARAGHLPTLSGSVSYGRTTAWGDVRYGGLGTVRDRAGDPKWGSTVGITLNVPIFAGGFTQSRVRQAVHERDAVLDDHEFNRRQVEANTRNSFRSVIAGASEVEATRAAVESAQSSVEATQAGYEVGTRTIVDVLLSQQILLNAQSAYSAARHGFVMDGLLLKQAAGVLQVGDLEAVNALLD